MRDYSFYTTGAHLKGSTASKMIRILFVSLLALSQCAQIRSMRRTSKQGDEKITFVQIKPLTMENSDLSRSSKTEDLLFESSPVYSLTINKASGGRLRRSTDDTVEDYDDSNKESEDRFDISEAVTDKAALEEHHNNDLTGFYNGNGASGVFKNKFIPKKYYGYSENSAYRKYLETRQFRNRCRCERIWNCPKIQISVPRCPEEYFMCCF